MDFRFEKIRAESTKVNNSDTQNCILGKRVTGIATPTGNMYYARPKGRRRRHGRDAGAFAEVVK